MHQFTKAEHHAVSSLDRPTPVARRYATTFTVLPRAEIPRIPYSRSANSIQGYGPKSVGRNNSPSSPAARREPSRSNMDVAKYPIQQPVIPEPSRLKNWFRENLVGTELIREKSTLFNGQTGVISNHSVTRGSERDNLMNQGREGQVAIGSCEISLAEGDDSRTRSQPHVFQDECTAVLEYRSHGAET